MSPLPFLKSIAQKNISDIIYFLVTGLLLFLYTLIIIEPQLVYYSIQPFFSFDPSYLDFFKTENLGALTILSNFFLQFLYFPIGGTLLLTFLLLILISGYVLLIKAEKVRALRGLELIPVLIYLIFFKEYNSGLQSIIILFIAFSILFGNRKLPGRIPVEKFIFHILSILITFFVFDIITAFTVTLFLILDEFLFLKTKGRYLLILSDVVVLAIIAYFLLGENFIPILLLQTLPNEKYALIPQFWPIILSHAGIMVLIKIGSLINSINFLERIPGAVRNNFILIILIILLIPFGKRAFVNSNKYYTEMGYYDSFDAWEEVLSFKPNVKINDRIPRFLMNRALYFTGRMPDYLFSIPQEWGVHTLILTMEFNRECTIHSSDLFFDMGFIKGAEYWALEAQTYQPYSPRILNRLVQCAILQENHAAANKYLAVMKRSPIYRKYSSMLLYQKSEENIENLRKEWLGTVKVNTSYLYINNPEPNNDLKGILEKDPLNKVAFEYLMSFYLLQNHIGNFMHFLPMMQNFEYKSIPKIYEEAILFYYLSRGVPVSEFKYPISQKTMDEMMNFNKTLVEYRYDEKSARPDLYKKFGQTYWYYLRYKSPETTGGELKKKGS